MADEIKSEEELAVKHKKERKELQARIQNLKKSICKGDKKRKKEITEEIAQLEINLDKKHEREIISSKSSSTSVDNLVSEEGESILTNGIDDTPPVDSSPPETAHRISKAQKRRDKKSNLERERNQRIIEQEAENVFGKRNVETQAITNILFQRHLKIHEIPSDGHCLYNAVSHQLKEIGETAFGFEELRVKTSNHLRENMDDFLPFLSNADAEEMLSAQQYEKYCCDVAQSTAWGGAIELQVLSQVLKRPIEVIQATGSPYVIGEEFRTNGKNVTITYHRHMYGLGAHYNSVTRSVKGEES